MQALRNKSQYKGLNRVWHSTIYSFQGLIYAYKNEKSLLLHGILSIVGILGGIFFNISRNQWSVLLISLGVILSFELVNTAVEAVVDMVTIEYHELAKIAKDCCSAATFVVSIISAIIAYVIFSPHIFALFR